MSFRKSLSILFIAGTLALAVSCSSPEEQEKGVTSEEEEEISYYSGKLSEEEMEGDHLALELCKKVTVDADITPYSKYKDGLNYYFISTVQQENKIDMASYQKSPSIFGKPVTQLEKMLEEVSGGEFVEGKKKVKKESGSISVNVPYQNADGTKGGLACSQSVDKQNRPGTGTINFWRAELADKENSPRNYYYNLAKELLECFPDYDMSDLSFGSREAVGEELLSLIYDTTGQKLSSRYVSMPVSERNYQALMSSGDIIYSDEKVQPLESEYYVYFFYKDLDGFPWESSPFQWKRDASEKFAENVKVYDARTGLAAYIEDGAAEQLAVYDADGIVELWLQDNIETSGIYKEKQEICAMDDLLIYLQEYFSKDTKLPTTIYDIYLSYADGLTEPGDGTVRGLAKPYWRVKFWKEWWNGRKCEELWVDTSTGECYINTIMLIE